MPVDPSLVALFTQLSVSRGPQPAPDDVAAKRQMNEATIAVLRPAPQAGVRVHDEKVAVEGGEITLRFFEPEHLERPGPCYCYFHGGGWFMGNLESAEAECVIQADDVPAVFVLVDYRLAPEHKFPVPFEDALAAYRYLVTNADSLGLDVERIAIGGGSAGANLSAAVCVAARDEGLPLPCLQLLEVPAVDLTLASASIQEFYEGYGLTGAETEFCVQVYVRDDADRRDPRASPIFTEDLSGLPPALVITAELDPVRDDGERYTAALQAAGTPALCTRILGQIHGTWIIPVTPAHPMVADLKRNALRRAFAGTYAPTFPG